MLPLELSVLLLAPFTAYVAAERQQQIGRAELGLPASTEMLSVRQVVRPGTHARYVFALIAANVGTRAGFEPIFGYGPLRTRRTYRGHPSYRGEIALHLPGRKVYLIKPTHWSPNYVALPPLRRGSLVELNLNPGRGWTLNGAPLFATMRAFEPQRRFLFRLRKDGPALLRYRPPGLSSGLYAALGGLLLLLVFFVGEHMLGRRPRPGE